AVDGIRDFHVTGVQTCALPIFVQRYGAIRVSQVGLLICAVGLVLVMSPALPAVVLGAFLIGLGYGPITPASSHLLARNTPAHRRSEERRVGKRCSTPAGA